MAEGARRRPGAGRRRRWGTGSDDVVGLPRPRPTTEERDLLDRLMAWQRREVRRRLRRHHLAGRARRRRPVGRPPRRLPRGGGGLRRPAEPRDLQRHHPARRADDRRASAPTSSRPGSSGRSCAPRCCAASCSPSPAPAPTSPGSRTSAVRDGDEWVVNGQKVWSSGARFSAWGELICRTDPTVPKHAGLTAFLLPMDAPGVEVRPIRQMSGGASFNEVFLTDVRVPDSLRLGDVGDGWNVALTTLAFERATSGSARGLGARRIVGAGAGAGRVGRRHRRPRRSASGSPRLYTPRPDPHAQRRAGGGRVRARRAAGPAALDGEAAVDRSG